MLSQTFDEAVKRPGSTLSKLGAEAITTHVGQIILVRQRWHSRRDVLAIQCIAQEDEVGEAATDSERRFHKRGKVRLAQWSALSRSGTSVKSDLRRDPVAHVCILGAIILFLGGVDHTVERTVPSYTREI